MAAPDYPTLYDIATPVETAFKTVLAAQEPQIRAFIQREAEDLIAEHVNIQFALGPWTGHWGVTNETDPEKQLAHAAWQYTLRLEVCTNRTPDDPGRHAQIVGQIRTLIQHAADIVEDDTLLPYHCLCSIDDQSGTPQVAVDDDQDVSQLTFTGIVSIREDAWPAVG